MGALITAFVTLRSGSRTSRATDRQNVEESIRQNFKVFTEEIRIERAAERAAWDAERQEYKAERRESQAERKELQEKVLSLTYRVDKLRDKLNRTFDHVIALERFIKTKGEEPPTRPEGIE